MILVKEVTKIEFGCLLNCLFCAFKEVLHKEVLDDWALTEKSKDLSNRFFTLAETLSLFKVKRLVGLHHVLVMN